MIRATLQGTQLVCVGFAEWDAELRTNQHHLMSRFATGSSVLFVESLGLRRPTATSRDLSRMARRLERGLRTPLRVDSGVNILSPLVVPYQATAVVRRLNRRLLRWQVGRAARKLGFERPILWTYVPQALDLVETLRPRLLVYHCVDDIAAHKGVDGPSFRAAEKTLLEQADLVIASSVPLYDRLSSVASNVQLMPNVADTEEFAKVLDPGRVDEAVDKLPRPRIVFVGAVSGVKVDLELLQELARARPDWSFVLVGPIGLGDPRTDVSELDSEPNVHLLGVRAHTDLAAVLRGADAGIVPYRLNELTASVFPMKVYEYLSAGLPTVATPLPALRVVDGISFAANAEGMGHELDSLLRADSPEQRRARSESAQRHSWASRIDEIESAVSELSWRP